jgi:16S rRNA (uracil1498-N3)-methyltransferase
MNLFYSPIINPPSHSFNREESGHIVRVLRLQEGEIIYLTDGKGTLYECEITSADPKHCVVKLISTTLISQNPHTLHVAIAPTKNISRFEWFLEKATEIGIEEITPLICTHSERKLIKYERLQKVLVAAMKQSQKSWVPVLHEPEPFSDFIKQEFSGQKFIAYCETGTEDLLKKAYNPGQSSLILIGPEGDFSLEEVMMAKETRYLNKRNTEYCRPATYLFFESTLTTTLFKRKRRIQVVMKITTIKNNSETVREKLPMSTRLYSRNSEKVISIYSRLI